MVKVGCLVLCVSESNHSLEVSHDTIIILAINDLLGDHIFAWSHIQPFQLIVHFRLFNIASIPLSFCHTKIFNLGTCVPIVVYRLSSFD